MTSDFPQPSPLLRFLALQLSLTYAEANEALKLGALYIDPPAYDDPSRLDLIIGKLQFLYNIPLSEVRSTRLAGWVSEHNDSRDAVIALRRATARGA